MLTQKQRKQQRKLLYHLQHTVHSAANLSLKEAKSRINKLALERWNREHRVNSVNNKFLPPLSTKRPKSTLHRRAETRLNRLILNQTRLNSNLHRMYPDFHPSPVCACGNSIADREHFLLHCTIHSASREKLFDQIDKGYHDTKTHFHLRSLNMERLIGPNNDLTPEMKLIIQRSVGSFLLSTLSTDI